MTWRTRLVESPELNADGDVDLTLRDVGDMWFLETPIDEIRDQLSTQYFAEHSGRKPLVVLLPGKHWFLLDGKCFSAERGYYDGWNVSGTPPNITVRPSINAEGRYHGWLTAGLFSDPV